MEAHPPTPYASPTDFLVTAAAVWQEVLFKKGMLISKVATAITTEDNEY